MKKKIVLGFFIMLSFFSYVSCSNEGKENVYIPYTKEYYCEKLIMNTSSAFYKVTVKISSLEDGSLYIKITDKNNRKICNIAYEKAQLFFVTDKNNELETIAYYSESKINQILKKEGDTIKINYSKENLISSYD